MEPKTALHAEAPKNRHLRFLAFHDFSLFLFGSYRKTVDPNSTKLWKTLTDIPSSDKVLPPFRFVNFYRKWRIQMVVIIIEALKLNLSIYLCSFICPSQITSKDY